MLDNVVLVFVFPHADRQHPHYTRACKFSDDYHTRPSSLGDCGQDEFDDQGRGKDANQWSGDRR